MFDPDVFVSFCKSCGFDFDTDLLVQSTDSGERLFTPLGAFMYVSVCISLLDSIGKMKGGDT